MDYKELTQQVKALEKEQRDIERSIEAKIRRRDKKILDLKLQYIEEHQPLPLKRFQRIKVRVRVTEASRKMLTDDARKEKRYALGATYTIIGVFNGYAINDNGEVVPCCYGKGDYRGRYDEILSVELTEDQPDGNCNKCLKAKDGHCYMMGGKDISVKCASHKVKADDYTCPKYEELTELWDKYGENRKHYPNVTICKHQKPIGYRIYALNWGSYCEWSQEVIDSNYTFENPNK